MGFLVSGSDDKTVKIWNFENGNCIQTLTGHERWVASVCISHDDQFLVSGSDKTVKIWNFENGNCIQTLTGHEHRVASVGISHDDQWIVSGSLDETIKIWNV